MTKFVASSFVLVSILTCGFARADEPGPNYKHLKPMEWIIGTWVLEMEAPEDSPADAPVATKQGDQLRMTIECEWGLNQNVIHSRFVMTVNGETVYIDNGMIGWAADKKQIVGSSFNSTGGYGRVLYTIVDEKTFLGVGRLVSPNGEVTEDTTTAKWVYQDTVTFTKTDIMAGGEKQPDQPPLKFKRVKK